MLKFKPINLDFWLRNDNIKVMLENKKNLVFLGVVALIGAGIVLYGYFSRSVKVERLDSDIIQLPSETNEIDPTEESVGTPVPTTPRPTPTETPFLGLHGVKAPATCQISGEAEFSSPGLYSSNTKLSWQNVDSQGRLINWRVSPEDELAIGPNIFANLTVPNGEYENLTIRLPENPVSKNYLLTVSITYGQIVQDDVKIREANCSGQVQVNLNF